MNTFLYIIIFIMGTLFGSFYTLAVYRIPRKIDIIKTHSFCPNCNHKLGFFELIPVWSYLLLGGKCKKCKQKIRPRYFILEFLSGVSFVIIAYCLKIDAYNLQLQSIAKFAFIALYLVSIFIIAGIDKEYRKIERGVLYYGLMVSCSYIIYLCIMGQTSIYRYVMYLVTLIVLLIIDSETQIQKAKSSYLLEILMLIVIMVINTGNIILPELKTNYLPVTENVQKVLDWSKNTGIITTGLSVIITFLAIGITKIIYAMKNNLNKFRKEQKDITEEIYKFGYLFSITNVIIYIGTLYFTYHG